MGWCQAFGPQIREGCDHSMVAGASSCSCPECGVICKGKFPGCATVWAAGPQQVSLRRPTKEIGGRTTPALAATNGRYPHAPAPENPLLPAVAPTSTGTESDPDLRSLMEALWADVRALRRQVDEVRNVAASSEPLSDAEMHAMSTLENLPQRVARAAGEAMRQQHQLNLRDLKEQWEQYAARTQRLLDDPPRPAEANRRQRDLDLEDLRNEWRQFAAEIETSLDAQLKEVVAQVRFAEVDVATRALKEMTASAAANDPSMILREFDARFEWLVNELSDRFVTLGNELVRIEKRLADEGSAVRPTNGQLAGGHAPQPRE